MRKMKLQPIDVIPVRTKIVSVIRGAILSGTFEPGQELSLTGLAEQLGVSRTPIREALLLLEGEGLISLRMNKGAVVEKINEKYVADHYHVRLLLETDAVRLACTHHMDVGNLEKLQLQAQENWSHWSTEHYQSYNYSFHSSIWKAADNNRMFAMLSNLWNGPSIWNIVDKEAHWNQSIKEHEEIINAIRMNDEESACRIMTGHIERSKESLLQILTSSTSRA